MIFEDQGYEWHEVTTLSEMSEGRRTFIRGRKSGREITTAAVDAFERFGTDAYGGIVDTRAGLTAALKELGIPVREGP